MPTVGLSIITILKTNNLQIFSSFRLFETCDLLGLQTTVELHEPSDALQEQPVITFSLQKLIGMIQGELVNASKFWVVGIEKGDPGSSYLA
jgi:hypothetical protein